jgi:hypothetical protein
MLDQPQPLGDGLSGVLRPQQTSVSAGTAGRARRHLRLAALRLRRFSSFVPSRERWNRRALPCASEVVPRTAKDRRRPVGHRDMPGPAAEEDSSASEQGAEDFEDAPSPERGATVVRHSPEICPRRCTLPSPTSRKGTPISSSRSPRKLRCARSPDDGRVAAAGPTAAAAAAPRPATAATAARAREDGGRESRPPSGAPRLPPLAPERHPRRRRRRRLPAPPRAVPQLGGEGQGKAPASRLPLLMGQKSTTTLPLWSACAPESVRARSHGLSQGIERPARDGLGPKCKRWHP